MNPDLALDAQLCFPLYAGARAVSRRYIELFGRSGDGDLTYPQYAALMALWEHDGISVGELGALLHLDSGTLTPLLKRLESAGIVDRRRDPADERRVMVSVTDDGWALRERLSVVPHLMRESLGLTDEEIDVMRSALNKMLAHLDSL